MCGGGSAPGRATNSTNANSPPVSLAVVLMVTNSLFDTQNDLPSPGSVCVMLTVDALLCLACSVMIFLPKREQGVLRQPTLQAAPTLGGCPRCHETRYRVLPHPCSDSCP